MKITVKQMLIDLAAALTDRTGDAETFVERVRTFHNFSTYTTGRYTDEGDTALLRRLYTEGMEWRRDEILARR